MKIRNALLIAGALVTAAAIAPAVADITYTQGSGTTIFDFTCFTTKHCSAHTPINSAGTEIFTSSAPGQVTGANGTFPATQSGTWNITNISGTVSLPTGAATSANQSTANTSLSTIATNSGTTATGIGAPADAAWTSGSGSIIAVLKNIAGGVAGAIPAGTSSIGTVGSDPSKGAATPTFASLSMSTATTTQIIALSGTTKTYVTSLHIIAGGSANVTLKYGTGTNCGTGTTTLVGPYPLAAQAGLAIGSGMGAVVIVPAGQALCVTSDAAVQVTTGATYQQL